MGSRRFFYASCGLSGTCAQRALERRAATRPVNFGTTPTNLHRVVARPTPSDCYGLATQLHMGIYEEAITVRDAENPNQHRLKAIAATPDSFPKADNLKRFRPNAGGAGGTMLYPTYSATSSLIC